MNLSTRRATESDRVFLWHLTQLAYKPVVIEQFGEWDESFQASHFNEKWPEQEFRIISADDKKIGAIWTEEEPDCIRLRELILLPEFRNLGIGSYYIEQAVNRARSREKPIELTVLKSNRAQELYKRLGFRLVGDASVSSHYLMRYDT